MPEPKRKAILTGSDGKRIDTLNDRNNPSVAQVDTIRIAKAGSRLGEILPSDERYGKAVKEALREVSGNE